MTAQQQLTMAKAKKTPIEKLPATKYHYCSLQAGDSNLHEPCTSLPGKKVHGKTSASVEIYKRH